MTHYVRREKFARCLLEAFSTKKDGATLKTFSRNAFDERVVLKLRYLFEKIPRKKAALGKDLLLEDDPSPSSQKISAVFFAENPPERQRANFILS